MIGGKMLDILQELRHEIQLKYSQDGYSILGLDLIFFAFQSQIQVTITNQHQTLLTPDTTTIFEHTNVISCLTQDFHFAKASYIINQNLNADLINIDFQIEVLKFFGIKQIKVYTNCVNNCLECSSDTSCNKCIDGFQKIEFQDQSVCEQTNDCESLDPNCYKCAKGKSFSKCYQCLPGYQLKDNQCQNLDSENNCNKTQYFDQDSLKCEEYSKSCYYQIKRDSKFEECNAQQAIKVKNRCPVHQMMIIYDYYNYSLFRCGCLKPDCNNCTNKQECLDCKINEFYNQVKKICEPKKCQENQYYDQIKKLCIKCGENCKICNSEKCIECISKEYVVTKNKCILRQTCQPNEYFDENSNKCAKCGQNCLTCSSQSCTKCNSDKFKINLKNQQDCFECPIQNCIFCQINNVCDQCEKDYILNKQDNTCIFNCQVQNCEKCQKDNNKQCDTCKQGFDISNGKCLDKCNVQNCQQCSQKNTYECQTCNSGFYYNSNTKNCEMKVLNNKLNINEPEVTKKGYKITIKPEQAFNNIPDKITDLFDIKISNVEKIKMEIEISMTKEKIEIEIDVEENVKNQKFYFVIIDQKFNNENSLSEQSWETNLPTYVKISDSSQEQIAQVKAVGQNVGHTMVSSFLPVVIFGNFYVLINMIDMTGFLYYLLYVNIRLPSNVTEFYGIFKNFQFPFIPNLFEKIINTDYVQTSPKKFMEMESDCYFIKNAGQSMTIMCFIIFLYILAKIFSKIKIKYVQGYFQRAIENTWEYGAFFDMLGAVYIYILVSALLQFYVFDFGDKNTYILNYILHAIFTVVCVLIPFGLVYILYKQQNLKDDVRAQKQLSSLVGGLKLFNQTNSSQLIFDPLSNRNILSETNLKIQSFDQQVDKNFPNTKSLYSTGYQLGNTLSQPGSFYEVKISEKTRREINTEKYSKYLNGILYIRKLIFCSFIVYLHNQTVIQLLSISCLNICCSFLYFYVMPHEQFSENIKNGICEILLLAIQITTTFFIEDDPNQDEEDRINVGWVIVSLSSIILIWNFLGMIISMAKDFFIFIKTKYLQKKQKIIQNDKNDQSVYSKNMNNESPEKNNCIIDASKEQQNQQNSERLDQIQSDQKQIQNISQFIQNIQSFGSITNLEKKEETPLNKKFKKQMGVHSVHANQKQLNYIE